jgi:dolichol-phosphate mannosyltransferase
MNTILRVIVIPSYNETLALPKLLTELRSELTGNEAVIVMDDSETSISDEIRNTCLQIVKGYRFQFIFENSGKKQGRGAAIRRGMRLAHSMFENLQYVIECDADGSHRAEDILRVMNSERIEDLLIGSRYLQGSRIIGWPFSRRLFSWSLNHFIPALTKVPVSDITNGLRRYSSVAIDRILATKQENSGFIYLSEQAIIVKNANLTIAEIPIVFVDRTLGKSTVTWREISSSLLGVAKLFASNPVRKR